MLYVNFCGEQLLDFSLHRERNRWHHKYAIGFGGSKDFEEYGSMMKLRALAVLHCGFTETMIR